MKKIRIVAPIPWIVLVTVVILGLGAVAGGVINQYVFKSSEAAPQTTQDWPLPQTMEDVYPAVPPQNTLDDYLVAAFDDAEEMSLYLDIAYPGAKTIWKEHNGFASKEEIVDFLATVQFGNCRHRAAYAYWLLQALYPASEIRAVVGYIYVPSIMNAEEGKIKVRFIDETAGLDSNHAWLTIDGEVFDSALNPETVRYYHPYGWCFYQTKVEEQEGTFHIKEISFPWYDVCCEEVEEQFKYDKGLLNTPKEEIPSWWYQ